MNDAFKIRPTIIPGRTVILPKVFRDDRGRFVKTYHRDAFAAMGLGFPCAEEYFTHSQQRVLRGLHFQRPPMAVYKLVQCLSGRVLDVAVDLRVGSPTFGWHDLVELSGEQGSMIYLPAGLAHGFYVLSEEALLLYKVSQVYSPEHDTGIRWDSAGIAWPDPAPLVSRRDQGFGTLASFVSPFRYEAV